MTYKGRTQRYAKRKNPGRLHRMNVYVTTDAYDKADRMAGPTTLSAFVEELIVREYRRREKRMVLAQDQAFICPENGAHSTRVESDIPSLPV